ncbi:MAG: DUF3168 domain-containing protein [Firmicutes bacterium]|nr:DUF3168 domain-containing protein [Bacillota bacterium]
MGKTADLRKLIVAQLNAVAGATYYRRAPSNTTYPYKTFFLSRVNLTSSSCYYYDLQIDIWDNATDPKRIEEIADELEDLLNASRLPQPAILPDFFMESRFQVDDPDKNIQHLQLTFLVELYTTM